MKPSTRSCRGEGREGREVREDVLWKDNEEGEESDGVDKDEDDTPDSR